MLFKLNRDQYKTQEAYLFHLYNDLGCVDLAIAYFDGNFWSKWFSFQDLQHKNRDELIWRGTTVEEFYEKANNRTILDIELLFDFDEDDKGSTNPEDIKKYGFKAIKKLNESGIYGECYFSGSKSIHYSVLVPELRLLSNYQRERFKERALNPLNEDKTVSFKADLQKKAKRTMIAMEGQFHWKTGNIKTRLKDE